MTGPAIAVSGVGTSGATWRGAERPGSRGGDARRRQLPARGVAHLFAFTTILGWCYYSEKCWEFLVGTLVEKALPHPGPSRFTSARCSASTFAWLVADTLNALMAIPTSSSLLLLSRSSSA